MDMNTGYLAEYLQTKLEKSLGFSPAVLSADNKLVLSSDEVEIKPESPRLPVHLNKEIIGYIVLPDQLASITEAQRGIETLVSYFAQERYLLTKIKLDTTERDYAIERLLRCREEELEEAVLDAELNGVEIITTKAVVLCKFIESSVNKADFVEKNRNYLEARLPRTLVAYIGNSDFCILYPAGNLENERDITEYIQKRLGSGHSFVCSVGTISSSVEEVRASYRQALSTQELLLQFNTERPTYGYYDGIKKIGIELDDSAGQYTHDNTIREWLANNPDLTITLRSFFMHNLHASNTALDLKIHRNTLNYRLDKIADETGHDVRIFSQAEQVRLAMIGLKKP